MVGSSLLASVLLSKVDAAVVAGAPNLKPPLRGADVAALVVGARLNGLGLLASVVDVANLKPPDVVKPENLS